MPSPLPSFRAAAVRLALIFAIGLMACQPEPLLPRCELSSALLDEVDGTRLLADVQRLVDFGERRSAAQQRVVAAWLAERFEALGYGVEQQPFTHAFAADYQVSGVNVEARRRGLDQPDGPPREVFLGAHFDSTSWEDTAPGALDNASGTAAVLEIARVLAPCAAARDLRFVLFSKEENADAGSREYLAGLDRDLDGQRVYLNLDMIGCAAGATSTLSLAAQNEAEELGNRASAAAARWTRMDPELRVHEICNWSTDTGPFCDAGDPALQISNATERECWERIHSPDDTPDLLERDALVEATRAALAMVLTEAGAALDGSEK